MSSRTLSIEDLRRFEACRMKTHVGNLHAALGRKPKSNEPIPLETWWRLPGVNGIARYWSLRAVPQDVGAPAFQGACRAARRVLPLVPPEISEACRKAVELAEDAPSCGFEVHLRENAAAVYGAELHTIAAALEQALWLCGADPRAASVWSIAALMDAVQDQRTRTHLFWDDVYATVSNAYIAGKDEDAFLRSDLADLFGIDAALTGDDE